MNIGAVGAFVATATALLGSPGPGIAALLAVGRLRGWSGGLRYFVGLQTGLAAAVAICGIGVVSLFIAYPAFTRVMVISATIYLVYLSYAIAASPVGKGRPDAPGSHSPLAGLLLGITNPKAYVAISSLLASPLRLTIRESSNIGLKAVLCMAVIIAVDLVWLWIGVVLGKANFSPAGERFMNVAMGVTILAATALSL
jgi:threonine/homoserine/homoserine lactone efflux protein